MTTPLARKCAGTLVVGFEGPRLDVRLEKLLRGGVGGIIAFARNVESPEQIAATIAEAKRIATARLLASVDQEGGRVARLRGAPFTAVPPMRDVGASTGVRAAREVGELLALEVRAMGFDMDFAPVMDVDTNPDNPIIGDRSFHSDAGRVAELGVALAQGLEARGVASSAKHFPGHGDTLVDSHLALPTLPHRMDRLRAVELVPFAAYARAGLACVMTAHITFPSLDAQFPATMSEVVLGGLLRRELGFAGVVVSDDLSMAAIAANFTREEALVRGLAAGVDVFLLCSADDTQLEALDCLIHHCEKSPVLRARLDESEARRGALVARFVRPAEDARGLLGSEFHRTLAAAVAGIAAAKVA